MINEVVVVIQGNTTRHMTGGAEKGTQQSFVTMAGLQAEV
jgi:hypothetical protein